MDCDHDKSLGQTPRFFCATTTFQIVHLCAKSAAIQMRRRGLLTTISASLRALNDRSTRRSARNCQHSVLLNRHPSHLAFSASGFTLTTNIPAESGKCLVSDCHPPTSL